VLLWRHSWPWNPVNCWNESDLHRACIEAPGVYSPLVLVGQSESPGATQPRGTHTSKAGVVALARGRRFVMCTTLGMSSSCSSCRKPTSMFIAVTSLALQLKLKSTVAHCLPAGQQAASVDVLAEVCSVNTWGLGVVHMLQVAPLSTCPVHTTLRKLLSTAVWCSSAAGNPCVC
jgi:hypothetical protein